MKKEQFAEVLGDINERYIQEAKPMSKRKSNMIWMKLGAVAACLCLLVCGAFMLGVPSNRPNPEYVQVVSPIMEVSSVEEMEHYLDFEVPVLDKAVETYIVMVIDGYPESARIIYKDGGCFNMKYGSGDISGIHGGVWGKEETINGTAVTYYSFEESGYALWEKNGFTYSLSGGENLAEEVSTLLK